MYLLYSLGLSLLFLALLPYFLYQAARHGKYLASFKERLGALPESVRGEERTSIWIHTVSVGEFVAARPLIERLTSELPSNPIVVSTTTLTGQQLARSHSALKSVFYFPFDWKFSVRRSLDRINPLVVVILETELWPNFLDECQRRGVAVVLANGRISSRSFARYQIVSSFVRRVVRDFSLMVMQSNEDAERALKLGARADHVRVCGNLKYDLAGIEEKPGFSDPKPPAPAYEEIDRQFALSATTHLIVAGSTAPEEEALLLSALKLVRARPGLEDTRMVIAPRHPERFSEVAGLIEGSGFTLSRRSRPNEVPAQPRTSRVKGSANNELRGSGEAIVSDVILLDSIGELAQIYRFATVVFVGGSLVPRGGHNVLEPAAFAKPIIVGPYTENFRQIVSDFVRADALVQLGAGDKDVTASLARELTSLLSDRDGAKAIGERARDILLANRGATECTVAAIKEVMKIED